MTQVLALRPSRLNASQGNIADGFAAVMPIATVRPLTILTHHMASVSDGFAFATQIVTLSSQLVTFRVRHSPPSQRSYPPSWPDTNIGRNRAGGNQRMSCRLPPCWIPTR